jgi:hypothetical protein
MATVTNRKPRVKPARSIKMSVRPDADCAGVVQITVGEKASNYLLVELAADFGRGFRLEKIGFDADGETYHVNLDGDKKTCDCKGFCRWLHCKHADGLAALIAAGKL